MQQSTVSGIPVASASAPALSPAARKARAEARFAQVWESGRLPSVGDAFYTEVLPLIGMTEKGFRALFAEARKVTKGRSGLYICTPTGCGRDR